jgi:uncharacterized protein (TIGR03086 family)
VSEIAERYGRLAADFTVKVAQVPEEGWASPSPCEGWTARDVVRHVIESHGMFLGLVGRKLGDIPSVDDDPQAAWDAARATVTGDLADPERASVAFDGYFGRITFEDAIDRFICFDLLVHSWDLARATGLDERLDPGEVHRVMELAQGFGEALRGPQVCGPALEPPPDADEQTQLLAFLGRRSRT